MSANNCKYVQLHAQHCQLQVFKIWISFNKIMRLQWRGLKYTERQLSYFYFSLWLSDLDDLHFLSASKTRRTRSYFFSCFFSYVKQNLSNMDSLNLDFQRQKHKYRASLAKTIKTGTGLTASSLSLTCPYTFVHQRLFYKCQIMKVRESQKFLTPKHNSEIFNTRA